ncbi:MAG: DUF2339 domain-containing protein [Planctomycetaceae bacterium]|jgi:hypothetical protein|nr:DUF2339 domain-containing protein [Planctomycetaceae bacterium]
MFQTLPLIARFFGAPKLENERDGSFPKIRFVSRAFAVCGGFALFMIASMECWYYFAAYPLPEFVAGIAEKKTQYFFARASLSVLWGTIACVVLVVGFLRNNFVVRYIGLSVLALTAIKIIGEDVDSIHFIARAALTTFWSVWGIALFVVGMSRRSQVLRSFALLIFLATAFVICAMQLFVRPESDSALVNAYFLPILFSASMATSAAVWGTRLQPVSQKGERYFLTAVGIGGLILLWGAFS